MKDMEKKKKWNKARNGERQEQRKEGNRRKGKMEEREMDKRTR